LSAQRQFLSVGRRFTAAANTYAARATIQAAVARSLVRLIQPSEAVARILEVGCGTGILTRHMLGGFPNAVIDAIDISEGMIAAASSQFRAAPTISWHAADARTFRAHQPYDLIVSSCALHWIHPLADGLTNLANQLAPGGRFAFSLMLDGTLCELHESRLRVAPGKPPLSRLPRLREVTDTLQAAGCVISDSCEETLLETYISSSEFLRALHELGLTGGAVSRATTPLSRGEIQRLVADYQERYHDENQRVRATFRVGYIRAARPA
jgi:malonyl-CoA O-methyltransferase